MILTATSSSLTSRVLSLHTIVMDHNLKKDDFSTKLPDQYWHALSDSYQDYVVRTRYTLNAV